MRTRVLIAAAAVILVIAPLMGCSDNSSERQRVVCEVVNVNDGAPLLSAYIEQDQSGNTFYTVDAVPVVFYARPYDQSTMDIPADDAYSSFIITGYNLYWTPDAAAPAGLDLTPYNRTNVPFFAQVVVGDDASSSFMVSDRVIKQAIFDAFGGPWGVAQDFNAYLRIEFIGHDSGSEHETLVPAGLFVAFTYALQRN